MLGRDNVRGGTWLGVTKQGRFSAVTNYRVPLHMLRRDARSRGELVVNFLKYEFPFAITLIISLYRHTQIHNATEEI